jgi:short-subunit dehydrogenase
MAVDLLDKVVVVTGASGGIGRATARAFARRCARVVLAARDLGHLELLADEIRRLGGQALPLRVDVTRDDDVAELVRTTEHQLGGIDVLVNNAGLGLVAPVAELTPELMHEAMEVNVYGALRTMRAVIPCMRARGGGVIVNVSAVIGKVSLPHLGGFCATKSALEALTGSLRVELEDEGIQVVLVCPGVTDTSFVANSLGSWRNVLRRPPTRAYSPDTVADEIVRATEQGTPEVVLTPRGKLMVGLAKLAPTWARRFSGPMVPAPLKR